MYLLWHSMPRQGTEAARVLGLRRVLAHGSQERGPLLTRKDTYMHELFQKRVEVERLA